MNKACRLMLFTLLSISICNIALAQNFKLSWGEETKKKNEFDDAVALDNGQYLELKLNRKVIVAWPNGRIEYTPELLLVNDKMETIMDKPLSMDDRTGDFKGFKQFGNNIYMMYSTYDKDAKATTFKAIPINAKDLTGGPKMILGTFESENESHQAVGTFSLSNDSSKVFLFVVNPLADKDDQKYFISVFDSQLKRLWKKDVELPIQQRYLDIADANISDDGKVFVAIKHFEKEIDRSVINENTTKIPPYTYELYIYSGPVKEKEITLNLNGNFAHSTKLLCSKNNVVTMAGLYKKKYNGNVTGTFNAIVDVNANQLKDQKLTEFPADMLQLVDNDNFASAKASDPGLSPYFKVNNILMRDNGSIDMISEYRKTNVVTSLYGVNNSQSFSVPFYHYGDIINTNIAKDGKITFTRIPKYQTFISDAPLYLGFYSLTFKDKLILLYNDNPENIEKDIQKSASEARKSKESVFTATIIDTKGTFTRQIIYKIDEDGFIVVPDLIKRIAENKYHIISDFARNMNNRELTRLGVLEIQ